MSQVYLPQNFDELWQDLAAAPQNYLYAGGTDLLIKRRAGHLDAQRPLICLERISTLREISENADEISLGAAATHTALLENKIVRQYLPALGQALQQLGSLPIRNMGTIGGNICTSSPAGDTLGPLYALDAQLELLTASGKRLLPIKDFILGPGKNCLKPGEILSRVLIKKQPPFAINHFEKVGIRRALACSLVNMTALLDFSDEHLISRCALAWGSVGPTIIRSSAVEQFLLGQTLSLDVLKQAANLVRQEVSPIDDLRANQDYRRAVAGNLLLRLGTV